MPRPFFDYSDGEFVQKVSEDMAVDSDGSMLLRMGDNMAMDMDTGDIHFVSSWSDDDDS